MPKQHQPWPYPRNSNQVIQVCMVTLAIIFAGLVVAAAWAEHYHNKMLDATALQQAAASLDGYAGEGAVEIGQVAHGRSTQHYQRAYLQELAKEARQVTGFLQGHPAPARLADQRRNILDQGSQLNDTLNRAATIYRPTLLNQAGQELAALHDNFAALEEAQ